MPKYLVIIQQSANNYGAYAPDIPGCITTGKTLEEIEHNMREALQLKLEVMQEDGEPLPLGKGRNPGPDVSILLSAIVRRGGPRQRLGIPLELGRAPSS